MARFSHVLSLSAVAFMALVTVSATQVMHRPDDYRSPLRTFPTNQNPKVNTIQTRDSGKASFAYFTNWGIYGANFQPTDVVNTHLTHILYSFADVDPSTATIKLTDSFADEQKHYPTDSWSETGNNLYGCLKQFYLQKLAKRNLKILLSIGGWTYAQDGHFNFITDPALRAAFVKSAVQVTEDYGFDGIDLDYEYPSSTAQGQGFADLITELRTAFTALQAKKGDAVPYQLTAAVAAGPANYQWYKVPQMDAALDYWNLMSYDYAGSWSNFTDNQANLYGGALTGFSTDNAIKWFVGQGATASKINMGMPLYGRAFENTNGLGAPYNGIGPGTSEAGIYSYKDLPFAGATVFDNTTDISSYSYDPAKKEFVSYDTPAIVKLKADYINSKGLAGSMFWELSTDKVGPGSLVSTASSVLGTLDQTPNHISYPNSKWNNIRNNMGSGSGGTTGPGTTSTPVTTTPSGTTTPSHTTTPPATTTSPSSGSCSGVAPWSAGTPYIGGQQASYNSHLWTAKWWSLSDVPGGLAGVWIDNGVC